MALIKTVYNIINQWQPRQKYRSEKKYQSDLRDYLHKKLNEQKGIFPRKKIDVKIQEKKDSCDLVVNQEVGIELKITTKEQIPNKKVMRLFDEILNNREKHRKGIIIVIVGKINDSTRKVIDHEVEKMKFLTKTISPIKHFIKNDYKIMVINKGYKK